jgi:hypothetical protein
MKRRIDPLLLLIDLCGGVVFLLGCGAIWVFLTGWF